MQALKTPDQRSHMIRLRPEIWRWLRTKAFYSECTMISMLEMIIDDYRQREEKQAMTHTEKTR